MAFSVVYDACVLYPPSLRDLLMRIGLTDLYQIRWTDQILNEMKMAVLHDREDMRPERIDRTIALMKDVLPAAEVTGYEQLVSALELPDPNDRHVLAAAIRANAQVIVTQNVSDFPDSSIKQFGIEVFTPDEFALHAIDLRPDLLTQIIHDQAADLKNPPMTVSDVLDSLANLGLVNAVTRLRQILRAG